MRKFTRIRGGYRASGVSGARSAGLRRVNLNPTFTNAAKTLGPTAGKLVYSAYKAARSRGFTGKIDPFIDFLLANPQVLGAFKASGANILNSGVALPGMGVLAAPRSLGATTITHPGTGVTLSRYTTSAPKLPNYVRRLGQRYIYNALTPESCFKVTNTDLPLYNGVAVYPTLRVQTLSTLRNFMFAGSGTPTTADSGWLSQQGGTYTGKMFLSNVRSEVQITSSTNLNSTLRIYELVCKESTGESITKDPISAWQFGMDGTLGNADANAYRAIGIFPGHSQTFRTYYHVDRMYDIKLPAGATHKHISTYAINKDIPNSLFAPMSSGHVFAGLTRHYLFVLSPSPVHDQTTEANVSLGAVSCDVVIKQTFEYYGYTGSMSVINVSVTGDTVTTPEAIADTSFVETGVIN